MRPAVHHDRQADRPFNGDVKPALIEDPFSLDPEIFRNGRGEIEVHPRSKIVATRSLRSDPLGRLYAHDDIDEVQYVAGRKFQVLYAAAEIGSTGSGSQWRERVQGGSIAEVLTEHQQRAMRELAKLYEKLGPEKSMLMMAVLGERMWFSDLAIITSQSARTLSDKFKQALNVSAQALGHLAKAA